MPRRRDGRAGSQPPLAAFVDKIGPPVARSPWSPDFNVQAIEVIPVCAEDGSLWWLKPVHADSLQVGLPKGAPPADVVIELVESYGLRPRVVHSTSWRDAGGRIVLTYVAVVDPPAELPADSLARLAVDRAGLARGDAMSAPERIAVGAVIEHALRHLRWLLLDDAAIGSALPGWEPLLSPYEPEPLRQL